MAQRSIQNEPRTTGETSGEAIDTPLAAEDQEALEAGIASVFEDLIAGSAANEDEAGRDHEVGVDATFVLLAELNRLWAEPQAA